MASHHGESDGTADSIPATTPTITGHDNQGQPSTGESAGSVPNNTSSAPEMEASVSDLSINDAPAEAEAEAEATESSSSTIDVASPPAPPSPPPAPTPPSPPAAPAAPAPPTPPAAPTAPSPPAPAAPTPSAPPAQPTPSEEPTAATTASTTTTTETTTSSEQPTSQGSTTSQPARPHYRPASPPLPPIPAEWQRSSSPRRPPVPPPAPLPPYPAEFTVGANSSRGTRSQQRRPSAAGSGTNARRTSSAFEAIPEPPLPPAPPVPRPQPQEPRQRRQDYPLPPRWQPDSEVTYCPICHQQFSIFVRKHHCRKCGRVVCNSCSPHRITIPYQYIVLPPGSQPYQMQTAGSSTDPSSDMTFLGGGERVRLCNPCVPDPNTAPPALASALSGAGSSNRYHSRSFSSANSSTIQSAAAAGGGTYHFTQSGQAPSSLSSRFVEDSPNLSSYATARPSGTSAAVSSMASAATAAAPSSSSSSQNRYRHNRLSLPPMPAVMASAQEQQLQLQLQLHHNQQQQLQQQHQAQQRHGHSHSHSHRSRPPQPQIAEEDECPICHRELPKRSLPNFETLREAHITECLETHSRYMGGSPSIRNAAGSSPASGAADPSNTSTSLPTSAAEASSSTAAPPPPRRTGVFPYTATEKDCVDDAECTICLEELEVGVRMARLECFCRFHEHCIRAWFKGHPGRCPVHQHDSFGY